MQPDETGLTEVAEALATVQEVVTEGALILRTRRASDHPLAAAALRGSGEDAADVALEDWLWDEVEDRLAACARCEEGGACADQKLAFRGGMVPTWQAGGFVAAPCDRWWKHELRIDLEASGIPRRFAGRHWPLIDPTKSEAAARYGREFWQAASRDEIYWLVVGSTRLDALGVYAAAMFWEWKRATGKNCRYEVATRLHRPLVEFYKSNHAEAEDPLWRLREYPLVALTELSTFANNSTLRLALGEVLALRHEQDLPTCIGVIGDPTEDLIHKLAMTYSGAAEALRSAARVFLG
jgi:hypothetical protein